MRDDARQLLRWRRLAAGAAARPDPPGLAAAPVPDRGQRRLRAAQRAPDGHRGGRRRACRRAGARRRPRAPTSRTWSGSCWARSAAARATPSTRTGDEAGDVDPLRKGDFLLTIDPAHDARRGPARRHRVQGPGHLRQADARRAGGGQAQPRRRGRPGGVHAQPRAGRHRAVRRAARVTSTASSTRRRRTRRCWTPRSGWPGCMALATLAEREVEVDTAAIGSALDARSAARWTRSAR